MTAAETAPPPRDPATITGDVTLTLHTLGLHLDDHQLTAILRALTTERRTAWRQGWHDANRAIRQASNAIAGAANWNDEAHQLAYIDTARAHRALLLDPQPRPQDYPGRGDGA